MRREVCTKTSLLVFKAFLVSPGNLHPERHGLGLRAGVWEQGRWGPQMGAHSPASSFRNVRFRIPNTRVPSFLWGPSHLPFLNSSSASDRRKAGSGPS